MQVHTTIGSSGIFVSLYRKCGGAQLLDVACVAIPKILAGLAQLGISVLLLRQWGVETFGQISICLAGIVFLDTILGSAIDMSIFRLAPLWQESDPRRARQAELAGLLFKPATGLMLFPLLLATAPSLSLLLFQRADLGRLLILTYCALLGVLLVRSAQVHFQIRKRFRWYAVTDLLHSSLRFGGAAVLLYFGQATPTTVLAVFTLGSFSVAALTLAGPARDILRVAFSSTALRALLSHLRWYLGTVVAGSVIGRMDLFLVSSVGRVADAGLYAAAQLFASLPQLLGIYMAAVFSPRVLPLWRSGEFVGIFRKSQAGLLVLAGAIYAGAVVLLNSAGGWLLPPAYQAARGLILILLPAGLAAMVAFPWAVPFLLYTRTKTLLALDCLLLPILAYGYLRVIPLYGPQGAAWLTSAVMLLRAGFFLLLANIVLRTDPGGGSWSLRNQMNPSLEMAGSTS